MRAGCPSGVSVHGNLETDESKRAVSRGMIRSVDGMLSFRGHLDESICGTSFTTAVARTNTATVYEKT